MVERSSFNFILEFVKIHEIWDVGIQTKLETNLWLRVTDNGLINLSQHFSFPIEYFYDMLVIVWSVGEYQSVLCEFRIHQSNQLAYSHETRIKGYKFIDHGHILYTIKSRIYNWLVHY